MLQIYICDDEPSVLKYLSGFISRIAQKNNLEICLSCYEDARQLIFDLEDHINGADIIYLDVLMNSCNGIEAGKKIRALGCEAQLLYLTNSKHHAIASFDTSPLHYILKDDIASEKFEHIFLAAVKKAQKKTQDISVSYTHLRHHCAVNILRRLVDVHLDRGDLLLRGIRPIIQSVDFPAHHIRSDDRNSAQYDRQDNRNQEAEEHPRSNLHLL